ncbi:MAG: type II toxin-antitoxin system VapB family antitoxin [Gemmatimonadaceae bacterium]|nr:type II toxin-antitoxin system VapB family antitoxin [Gemmatimonadaceae bacterium]
MLPDDEICRLADELARLTGETRTKAVTVALRERLEREKRKRSAETRAKELRAIAERCARLLGPGPSASEHGDLLYDERGLPG